MTFLLQHLLSESAEKYPDRTAVIYKDRSITYRELEIISNKLAGTLIETGVHKGDRVGIYMAKSIHSIICILGILKAGGAYVPIAPDAPGKRVEYIIRNCAIKHLLSAGNKIPELEEIFPSDCPLETIISTDCELPESRPAVKIITWGKVENSAANRTLPVTIIDKDLAYILYTSGSTGEPKGVMISHLNSLTFVNWAQEFFRISQEDRVANHSPLHFDLSIFDIFATFKAGATVVIVPDGTATFPIRLAELIEKQHITVWNSVPSVLVLLVTHGKLENFAFPKLRLVLFAGEIFPVKYLRQLKEHLPHVDFYNQYGQTEANSSTYYHVIGLPDDDTTTIPIGKAAADFEVFALDENNHVISRTGETGELYVRSSTVAQGYWGDPVKTGLAFVENPLRAGSGEKVYKTGDLVTLDENGDYCFLSRKDNMVKSRGYRIELGEIEAAILSHPGVKEAAAVAIPDEIIGNRIRVFMVPFPREKLTPGAINQFCSQRIPKYMLPETIEFREALPRTSTGKIDKKALAAEARNEVTHGTLS